MATELARLGLARAYRWKGRPERPLGPLPAMRAKAAREPVPAPRTTKATTPVPAAPRVSLEVAAAALKMSPTMLRDWLVDGAPVLDLGAIVAWRSGQASCGSRELRGKRGTGPQFDGARGFLSRPVVR